MPFSNIDIKNSIYISLLEVNDKKTCIQKPFEFLQLETQTRLQMLLLPNCEIKLE